MRLTTDHDAADPTPTTPAEAPPSGPGPGPEESGPRSPEGGAPPDPRNPPQAKPAPWPPADDGKGGWVEIIVRARVRYRTDGALEAQPPVIEYPVPCPALAMAAAVAPIQLGAMDLAATAAQAIDAPIGKVMQTAKALTDSLIRQRQPKTPQGPKLILAGESVAAELLRDVHRGVPLRGGPPGASRPG